MITQWKVTVVKADGTSAQHAVTPRTIVAFERHFKLGLAQAFTKDQKQEHVFWLGWEAERSAGMSPKPFDSWLEDIAGVNIEVDNVPFGEEA